MFEIPRTTQLRLEQNVNKEYPKRYFKNKIYKEEKAYAFGNWRALKLSAFIKSHLFAI